MKDVATGQTLKSLVTNEGKLKANGGRVELTAAAARHVVDSVINTSGVIEANSVGMKNGQIVLCGRDRRHQGGPRPEAAELPAAAPPQTVSVSGTLSAAGKKKGTKGGNVIVTGENIEVAGATIDASGRDGRRQGADRRRLGRRQAGQVAGQQSERGARELRDPDRHDGERRCRDHDRCVGERHAATAAR